MLGPYEDIILNGKADAEVKALSGNAVVKRVRADRGSLVLVSEYSRRPLAVKVECPVAERSRVVDLSTGKQIGSVTPANPVFAMNLKQDRAVMLYVGR